MDPRATKWLGKVMTVHGPIPADELGVTLPHEHILIRHQGPLVDAVDPILTGARSCGFRPVRRPDGGGHNERRVTAEPAVLKQVSAQTSVHIGMGTGYYKDGWLPAETHTLTVDEMAEMMVGEILNGVGPDPIHAGVIGEMGISTMAPTEEPRWPRPHKTNAGARRCDQRPLRHRRRFRRTEPHGGHPGERRRRSQPRRVGSFHLQAG